MAVFGAGRSRSGNAVIRASSRQDIKWNLRTCAQNLQNVGTLWAHPRPGGVIVGDRAGIREDESSAGGRLDPSALSASDLAALLTRAAGVRIEAQDIEADIDAGAPTNADGTINLVHYAAWLVREMGSRGD